MASRCSAEQQKYAAAKQTEKEQEREARLTSETLLPARDAEWTLPNGAVLPQNFNGHTGIFIRDGNLTAAGKKVWWKSLYEWKGWETKTYGEKVTEALNEIYENPIGRKLIHTMIATNPAADPAVPTGYKAIIVRPFDLDPTDDMKVHEQDFSEVETILDRIAPPAELTQDQVNAAKVLLKEQWDLARVRIGDCFENHDGCKNVMSTNNVDKNQANFSCPVPDIAARVDAVTDLASLRTLAGHIKAYIDGTPRYWNKFWRDGSHIANGTWKGAETQAGHGKPGVAVFHPAIDHLPGVHVTDNNGATTYTLVRYNNGEVREQIGTNSAIPVSLGLAHELIHVLHMLQGTIPRHGSGLTDTSTYYERNCSQGGRADDNGLYPGVSRGFHVSRAQEEWKTVGIIDRAATPDANKWPACVKAGGNVDDCAITENNIRAAWRVKADGTPGKYPNLPKRASYTSRLGCQLDDDTGSGAGEEDGGYAAYSLAAAEADGGAAEGPELGEGAGDGEAPAGDADAALLAAAEHAYGAPADLL